MFIDLEFAESIGTMTKAELELYYDELMVKDGQLQEACLEIDIEMFQVRERLKTLC